MRVKWDDVFKIKDGWISPKHVVNVGGVQMTPKVSFKRGSSFGGVNLAKHAGKDLEIEKDKDTGVVTIKRFY